MEEVKLTEQTIYTISSKDFSKFSTCDKEKALEVKKNLEFATLLKWFFDTSYYAQKCHIGVNNEGVPITLNDKHLDLAIYKSQIVEFCDDVIKWVAATKFPIGLSDVMSYAAYQSDQAIELKRIILKIV